MALVMLNHGKSILLLFIFSKKLTLKLNTLVYNVRMSKKTANFLFIISSIALASCGGVHFNFPSHSVPAVSESISSESVSSSGSAVNESSSITSETVSSSSESTSQTSEEEKSSSPASSSSSPVVKEDRKLHLYAINDFHGQIVENPSEYEMGAGKLFSYLKDKNDQGNVLLCNQGDLYQGSLESNYNRGHLLTDVMNYTGFDCMTLGNHEFDWSQSAITLNKDVAYATKNANGYKTPFLAANIYDYDISTKKTGSTQQSQLGKPYTISTLENGLKVGIIGVIGSDQITSITSQFVDNIVFTNPIQKVKELSDKLRTEDKVDVVIASIHSGTDTSSSDASVNQAPLASVSTVSGKRYCDAVLTAHTHYEEYEEVNGVPFIQDAANGKAIGNLEFTVKADGTVSYESHSVYHYADIKNQKVNPDIQAIIDAYALETTPIGNEKLTTFSGGSWSGSNHVPNILAESLYKEAVAEGYDIQYAMVNKTRATIPVGDVTYSGLFNSVPFDNEIMIVECSGADLINEASYNFVYRGIGDAVESTKTYKIAVLDYLATHRNKYRNYDYFPSMKLIGTLEKSGKSYLYRDILADYLKTKTSWSNANYSTNTNNRFNKTLTNSVAL